MRDAGRNLERGKRKTVIQIRSGIVRIVRIRWGKSLALDFKETVRWGIPSDSRQNKIELIQFEKRR